VAKRTKTQKKTVAYMMGRKAKILFMEGLISAGDVETVQRLVNKAMKKL